MIRFLETKILSFTGSANSKSTSYDPTAPENLQLVLYRGPKDTTPPVKLFKLPSFPDLRPYIKEAFKKRNVIIFGISGSYSSFITTTVTINPLILIFAFIIGGLAFSILKYQLTHRNEKRIDPDDAIFNYEPPKITTKEEALEYLDLPLNTTDLKRIQRRVAVRLKQYNQHLERRNQYSGRKGPSDPVHPLYTLIEAMAKDTIKAYELFI
jgi:hypothetical protein